MSQWKKFFVLALIIIALAACGESSTVTSVVTPTSQPTQAPTPTVKPAQISIQDQLQSIAENATGDAGGATVSSVDYDASVNAAYVHESFILTGDNNMDIQDIKDIAYAVLKATWQAHIKGIDSITILFDSDSDGTRIASCENEHTTAAKMQWGNLTSNQAWSDYDYSWLSQRLS